jgi:hypothetical protein
VTSTSNHNTTEDLDAFFAAFQNPGVNLHGIAHSKVERLFSQT